MKSTSVTFPDGALTGRSQVVGTVPVGQAYGVVVAETPFHPLDHTWADQPADRGTLDGRTLSDCLTGAQSDGGILLGSDIPVRRGSDGWEWLVVHVIDAPIEEGREVELEVDGDYRAALSAGHTGCHLAALALNMALASQWRKETAHDALGHPDFDQQAITSSSIVEHGAVDVYRLGKSLRKKGFTAEGLDLAAAEQEVNAVLARWVAADAPVWVDVPGPELTARRTWHCALPDGEAWIPCGGTHVTRTSALGPLAVTLELGDDYLRMTSGMSSGSRLS
ncbi:metal-dependent hydrolase [Nonomuraea sp. NPDC050663]|uniref:metal-dependent hydrolase n=1 Tax=Nonomuraea sp. NPDC050663 TaxID=3364370 RepID=UPI00379B99D4